MLIKPFKSVEEISNINTIKNIKTDVTYIPYDNHNNEFGRLVVSKKYLIKNFTSTNNTTFVKLVYYFIHECESEIKNIDDLRNTKIGDLNLRYITTSLYDSDPNHFFGNLIYDTTTPSQAVHTIFDYKQNVDTFSEDSYTINDVNSAYQNAMFLTIDDDNKDGSVKFGIMRGINKNFQLHHDYRIRTVRQIQEILNSVNLSFNSYKKELKSDFDSFDSNILLGTSQEIHALTYDKDITAPTMIKNEIIIKKDALDRIMSDTLKPLNLTMIDNLNALYINGELTISKIKYPFDKMYVEFVERALLVFRDSLCSSILEAEKLLGRIDLMISISDTFVVAKIKFLENGIGVMKECETLDFQDECATMYLYNYCKSKRYKRNHQSNFDYQNDRIGYLMDYFYEED